MFYPLQSSQYTWVITKGIFQTFRSLSAIVQLMICLFMVTGAGLVTFTLSIEWAILLILFIWICLIDLIDRMIPDILSFGVLFTIFYLGIPFHWVGCLSIITLILLKTCGEHLYKGSLIGWGDVKLMGVFLVFTPLYQLPIFLLTTGVAGISLSLVFRTRTIPFAPCIILGFIALAIWG